jgi:hypothetical protein
MSFTEDTDEEGVCKMVMKRQKIYSAVHKQNMLKIIF